MESRDHLERSVMVAVAAEIHELRKIEMKNQAILIAEQVGKLFGG